MDVWLLERVKNTEDGVEGYRKILSEPTPLQKGPYAGLLKARPSNAGSGFMDFMNNS